MIFAVLGFGFRVLPTHISSWLKNTGFRVKDLGFRETVGTTCKTL